MLQKLGGIVISVSFLVIYAELFRQPGHPISVLDSVVEVLPTGTIDLAVVLLLAFWATKITNVIGNKLAYIAPLEKV